MSEVLKGSLRFACEALEREMGVTPRGMNANGDRGGHPRTVRKRPKFFSYRPREGF